MELDLKSVVARIAKREGRGAEANPQADIRTLLLHGGLNIEDNELVELEAPAGGGKRIDIEIGSCVIECKRDLRIGSVRERAVEQLAGYVSQRTDSLGRRYVGVLTDGAEWRLYHLTPAGSLEEVALLEVDPARPDIEGLCWWLEGVLATRDEIEPLPSEIRRRLGTGTPTHQLDLADLRALYDACKGEPEVQLKRQLWAGLLTTAFGQHFENDTDLFLKHTYLVITGELIAHAVINFDIAQLAGDPEALITGKAFADAGIGGVVESDFFDWVLRADGGNRFVTTIARRLARFRWTRADHEYDVLKVLYESVIDQAERKSLGEYYTPDWLACKIVNTVVDDPKTQRVLDPACGSGTFLFHAVRKALDALAEDGMPTGEAIANVCSRIFGFDVHPVAVTLARVTYLLAIGTDRILERTTDLTIPVYLADSLLMKHDDNLLTSGGLTVYTDEETLFRTDLHFPMSVVADVHTFDQLLTSLARRIVSAPLKRSKTGEVVAPSILADLRKYNVAEGDQPAIQRTFSTWCGLYAQGRNHIWGYYIRNLARPYWLSRIENRVDRLIGNPPWLSYRFMPRDMQKRFVAMSKERHLWAAAKYATNMDLSGLFVTRTCELYLRNGGRFGFVMPHAVIAREQFEGFRQGQYPARSEPIAVRFDSSWDLEQIEPTLFPVPSGVVFGQRADAAVPMPSAVTVFEGKLSRSDCAVEEADRHLTTSIGKRAISSIRSPYFDDFTQGAALVPRVLICVEDAPPGPLGPQPGRRSVRSLRSKAEKAPWKNLSTLTGSVESEFVRPMHLGLSIAPFRLLEPWHVAIPWTDSRELTAEELEAQSGMQAWWMAAQAAWKKNGTSALTLEEQIDYQGKLTRQLPADQHRVIYVKSGESGVAARLDDPTVLVDNALYWASVSTIEEGQYLIAVFNSETVKHAVRPLISRGQFGARNLNRFLFYLPIARFAVGSALHRRIAKLGADAEVVAAAEDVGGLSNVAARQKIRAALASGGLMVSINEAVRELFNAGLP